MKKMFNNSRAKALGTMFMLSSFWFVHVLGINRRTNYFRKSGVTGLPITCAAKSQIVDVLAVKYDGANSCENLGWEWGHTYDGVSIYFEKQHVVEVFDEPMVLGGTIRLPILFNEGAFIDMHIEFTSVSFTYGHIQLLDILQGTFNVYDGEAEKVMIRMEMRPSSNIIFKTWAWGWVNRANISPFPLTTGIVYKVTFKALGYELQVLVDDQQYDRYAFGTHSSEAKLLDFTNVGMLLHKIEFVA